MNDLTMILAAVERGEALAAEQLLPLVYEELRMLAANKLKHETPGQTLQPTALVHEAYLRLVDQTSEPAWDSRAHFFGAAAEAMRRILVDRARRKIRPKHGGQRKRVDFDGTMAGDHLVANEELLAVHEALELYEREDATKARLVKLRYFAGMSLEEAAAAMKISRATASRYWTVAKARLYCKLQDLGD